MTTARSSVPDLAGRYGEESAFSGWSLLVLGVGVGAVMAVLFALGHLVFANIFVDYEVVDPISWSVLVLMFALPFGLVVGAGTSVIVWVLARWMYRWATRTMTRFSIVVVCLLLSGTSWVGLNLMLTGDQPMDWLGSFQWLPGPLAGGLVGGLVLSRYVARRWTR